MVSDLQANQNLNYKAKWEQKTDSMIQKGIIRNKVHDMNKRQAIDIRAKRAKLAALLAAEDKMYEREFMENQETPEQVRAKMAQRLEALKAQRE